MYFYHVLARLPSYHGADYLTYRSDASLAAGSIVDITVRGKPALGIVMARVAKPAFATKPLGRILLAETLPASALELIEWLRRYYPAPLGTIAQLFLPASLSGKSRVTAPEPLPALPAIPEQHALTPEQRSILDTIDGGGKSAFMLHGDTGTGKTRIYTELAAKSIAAGRSALLLSPEIGLTAQLLASAQRDIAGTAIVVLHSELTPRERREAWLRIIQAKIPQVVIGPRSVLFSPLGNIGLIVVDEFHEAAYKQEQAPYYQAVRAAAQLARIHDALLILGSATPPVADYFVAHSKGVPILRMTRQAAFASKADRHIELVDMRDRTAATRNAYLSNKLLDAVRESLSRREQALIFLNRRGTARIVLCHDCGWQAACPDCDIPLTYHADTSHLQCHTCGYRQAALLNCPVCRSPELLFKSVGTKAVFESLRREFPRSRIQRFDTDNTKPERLERHYREIAEGKVDILVGTQLLGKGLDLPYLGVVGVVAADNSLYFPDYMAEEQTYQILSQVIGRVGRGHRPGKAIIQTFTPDNPTLRAVITGDWQQFYERQLSERQQFLFPPFCYLLKLTCTRASRESARNAAVALARTLASNGSRILIAGPSPSFYEKVAGKYRWQLVIKSKSRDELLRLIPLLPSGWNYDIDPAHLL